MRLSVSLLLPLLGCSLWPLSGAQSDKTGYVGAAACLECHAERVKAQSMSNHARTWRLAAEPPFGADYKRDFSEGTVYRVEKQSGSLRYEIKLNANERELVLPVHSIVGGERFGYSFLVELKELQGLPLNRPTLIEARHMHSTQTDGLVLSPGFPPERPVSYSTALGRILSASFEKKCLNCHGGIRDLDSAGSLEHPIFKDVGVRCERCHGPARGHVEAMKRKETEMKIVHPGKLPNEQLMEICAECHSGFSAVVDPRPQDLLISNQVTALKLSTCYVKSGGQITCLNCHNPHVNAKPDDPIYVRTCLSCHASQQAGRKQCPVNSRDDCIRCHMPVIEKGAFHLRDHWIRVVERPLPINVRDIVSQGVSWAERGLPRLALQEFEKAQQKAPDEPSVYYNLGIAYEEAGRPQEAAEAYGRAIELEPDMVSAYINLGSLLMSEGKVEEAIVQFSRGVEVNPLDPIARYNLAIAYETKGDREKAQQEFALAAAVDPRLK